MLTLYFSLGFIWAEQDLQARHLLQAVFWKYECSEKQFSIHKFKYEILPFLSAIFSFVKSGVSITESNFDLRRPDLLGSSENSIL